MHKDNVKESGDNESLACKDWSTWSKLEQTDLGGQMTPMEGRWCIFEGIEAARRTVSCSINL